MSHARFTATITITADSLHSMSFALMDIAVYIRQREFSVSFECDNYTYDYDVEEHNPE